MDPRIIFVLWAKQTQPSCRSLSWHIRSRPGRPICVAHNSAEWASAACSRAVCTARLATCSTRTSRMVRPRNPRSYLSTFLFRSLSLSLARACIIYSFLILNSSHSAYRSAIPIYKTIYILISKQTLTFVGLKTKI